MKTKKQYEHGTYASYTNSKCRCTDCKKAASEYMRKYRKTETGRLGQKYYQTVAMRRSQMATYWIKTNHPKIWDNICREVSQIQQGSSQTQP